MGFARNADEIFDKLKNLNPLQMAALIGRLHLREELLSNVHKTARRHR